MNRPARRALPWTRTGPSGHPERGASLVFALVFITTFAFVVSAVLTMGRDSLATGGSLESYRIQAYGSDGALDLAIASLRADATLGREGNACPTRSLVLDSGATAQVTCTPESGSGAQLSSPGANLSYALITEPAAGETGVEVAGAATTARVRGLVASGSGSATPQAPAINGGLSWGGWTSRGTSDQVGLYARGSTGLKYEVFTTLFTFDKITNVVTGNPIQNTNSSIPSNFNKGTLAGPTSPGFGFTNYNQGQPALSNPTNRPVTSGGAFDTGNTVLGIGVRVVNNSQFEAYSADNDPDTRRGVRWGAAMYDARFVSFGLNQGSNTSFTPATSLAAADGRTSFRSFSRTGDFAVSLQPGSFRFTGQEVTIANTDGVSWGGSNSTINLCGGFHGSTGGCISYDFAYRAFAQEDDAADIHTYQMFFDLTAMRKLYGPDDVSEDSILDIGGRAAGNQGIGTIDPSKLVVALNGWGDNSVVFPAQASAGGAASPSVSVASGSTLNLSGAATASGGCTGTVTPTPSCNSSGFAAVRQQAYAPFMSTTPNLSGLAARTVPACPTTAPNYVALQPGEYTDAAALSALTNGACPNAIVHLLPGVFRFRFTGGGVWVIDDPTVNVVAGEPLNWSVPAAQSSGGSGPQSETALSDGGFETQAVAQNLPQDCQYTPPASCRSGQGASWSNSWPGGASSWQGLSGGVWQGGAIARTEDFATGWKWARAGNVFGIVKDRQTLSQTFTATRSGTGTLSWFDANRAAWRNLDWYGFPNSYSVTITDSLGNTQLIGNYSSVVAGGNSWSTPPACWDSPTNNYCWWTTQGKSTWFAKEGTGFTLQAGQTYTLKFNSLAPTDCVNDQCDRTTFLDDISLSVTPAATPAVRPRLDDLARLCKTDADPAPNEGTLLAFDADARMDIRAVGPSEFCGYGATWPSQRVSVYQASNVTLADPTQPLLDVGATTGRSRVVVRGTVYARAAKIEVLLRDNVNARFERGVYARTVSMPGYATSASRRVYTPFTLAGVSTTRADRRVRFEVTVNGVRRLSATVLFTDDGGGNPGAMVKVLSYRPS